MRSSRSEPGGPGMLGWLLLYALTAALEAPVVAMRYLTMLVAATVALRVTGHPGSASGWAKLALLPTLWSLLALVNPAGGGWWWQQRMGGRSPSAREAEAVQDALSRLRARGAERLRAPRRWFVVDEPRPRTAVCGDTLMLSRGALESPHLPAIVAHELGHLRGIDARLMAAVDRLAIDAPRRPAVNPRERSRGAGSHSVVLYNRTAQRAGLLWSVARWAARQAVVMLHGGVALRMLAPAWGVVWREAEYRADAYAASLGEGEELAEFLEGQAASEQHPVPWPWLSEAGPPMELRVERLRAAGQRGEAV